MVSGVKNVEVSQLALLAARQGVGVAVCSPGAAAPSEPLSNKAAWLFAAPWHAVQCCYSESRADASPCQNVALEECSAAPAPGRLPAWLFGDAAALHPGVVEVGW